MSLDKEKKDRSYQFGRLLAVMEKVERDTYTDEAESRTQFVCSLFFATGRFTLPK